MAVNTKFFTAAFLLGIMVCGLLLAQADEKTPLRLTPDEAVEKALKNNLSLESARVTNETKKRASDLSWNQFIPNVIVAGSLMIDNGKNRVLESADAGGLDLDISTSRLVVGGQIQASLNLSIAMFENMNRLKLDYQNGLIAYDKAKLQLERDVRKAYNSMLLLQQNISLLNENYEAAMRRVQLAQANYRAGLVPELTYLQAQVAVENMKPMIDQAENGMRLSLASFAMFLGLPYNTSFELLPAETGMNFIPLDVQEMISKAATGKPDIQELRHTILMLQSARKTQFNALLPSLSLSWNTSPFPSFIQDKTETTFINPPAPLPSVSVTNNIRGKFSSTFTIALALRLHSLFPFSADFQAVKNMDDQIQAANIGLAMMIQGTEIEIYNTVLILDRIRITAEAQAQTISLAERSFRLTEQAFRAGLQDLMQVQNAELELKQAKVSMLEQQFNYFNSLIDLEYAIGVPFGTLVSNRNLSSQGVTK